MKLLGTIWQARRFWLIPVIVLVTLIIALLLLSGGDVLKPFTYDRL